MPMKRKAAKKAPLKAKAGAVKSASHVQQTAQEEVGNYGQNYGDATRPIETRRVGTQPNNRAKNAVERAQERMDAMRGNGRAKARPGAEAPYDADERPGLGAVDDGYEDEISDEIEETGPGDEYYPSEDEVAQAQEKMSKLIAKRNGGKKHLPHGARMAPIGHPEESRGPRREAVRYNEYGRALVKMRDGRIISRTSSTGGQDKFDVPVDFIPDGWSYQWIAVAVNGKPVNNTGMFANGWEPVPALRHDGFFMAKGEKGAIIVDDLMLCERRVELTMEARAEEVAAAKSLLRTQNDQFKPQLPEARNRRGTGLRVKRTYERMPGDLRRPNLHVDDGDY